MKKVKMIVTACAVFAVVGSALAFRAFNPANIFCDETINGITTCTLKVNKVNVNTGSGATTNPCNESTTNKHYNTEPDNTSPCPIASITVYTPNPL